MIPKNLHTYPSDTEKLRLFLSRCAYKLVYRTTWSNILHEKIFSQVCYGVEPSNTKMFSVPLLQDGGKLLSKLTLFFHFDTYFCDFFLDVDSGTFSSSSLSISFSILISTAGSNISFVSRMTFSQSLSLLPESPPIGGNTTMFNTFYYFR